MKLAEQLRLQVAVGDTAYRHARRSKELALEVVIGSVTGRPLDEMRNMLAQAREHQAIANTAVTIQRQFTPMILVPDSRVTPGFVRK